MSISWSESRGTGPGCGRGLGNKLESLTRLAKTLKALRSWERRERPDAVICFSTHLSFQLSLASASAPTGAE
ncbi:MAG: hypothetical protein V8T45_03755 [Oscillospiraceae bacterium]